MPFKRIVRISIRAGWQMDYQMDRSTSLKYQKTEMKVMEWVSKGQALSSEGKPEGQTLSFKVNTYFSLLHILHGKFLESRRLREKGEEERKKKEEAERRKKKEEKCDML